MAIAMLQVNPGMTSEQYEKLGERMFGARSSDFSAAEAPDGLLMHSAGPHPDGWMVYDIWQSREHLQKFFTERLMPAAQELGLERGGEPQIIDLYNIVHVGQLAAS